MGQVALPEGELWRLSTTTQIGRTAPAHLRVPRAEVSRAHAQLSWESGAWQLRDLGSHNGTTVDGRSLSAGERCTLQAGASIGLGRTTGDIQLVDASPPEVFARNVDTGEERVEGDEGIALPEGLIRMDGEHGWVIDRAGALSPAPAQWGPWQIFIPDRELATRASGSLQLESLELRFRVSNNLEHVGLILVQGGRQQDLGIHSEFWPLLLLARARLRDPEGWVDIEQLARDAAMSRKSVDVYFSRVRRKLLLAEVIGADAIISCRRGERRLAVQPHQISEEPL
jgi:FHA domain